MSESLKEKNADNSSVDALSSELSMLISQYITDLANQTGEFAFEALRSATRTKAQIIQGSADMCLQSEDPKSSLASLFAQIDSSFPAYFEQSAQTLKDDISAAVSAVG